MKQAVLALALSLAGALAAPVLAMGVETSPRPMARDVQAPQVRLASAVLIPHSVRPTPRPDSIVKKAMAKQAERKRGAVCGDLDIQGTEVGAVPGKIRGCGVGAAVRVRAVSGISLSQQSVMDCTTAKALKSWVDKGLKPAVGTKGGGVAQIRIAGHYSCRTRNNQKGAKISEHGRGRAVDISGFTLHDGAQVTVLRDWGSRTYGKMLKTMHRKACGPFGTVLGPNANVFHRDHFHFDTARYRSGSYCR